MRKPDRGALIILTAPSGTGKSTVVAMMLQRIPDLAFSVSYTTRQPRLHEQDGKDYFFVDDGSFSKMAEEGRFLESAVVHGHRYGTSSEFVDRLVAAHRDVLLDVDVQGATQLLSRRPDAVSIFLLPPSFEELGHRLAGRGTESEETIQRRLDRARQEVRSCDEFDYVVVNDHPEETYEVLRAIVVAERARPERRPGHIKEILSTFVES